jgi:hypothetical protein
VVVVDSSLMTCPFNHMMLFAFAGASQRHNMDTDDDNHDADGDRVEEAKTLHLMALFNCYHGSASTLLFLLL